MKFFVKSYKNKTVNFVTFEDMFDVRKHIDEATWQSQEDSSKKAPSEWNGNVTYDQAIDMLTTGFDITKCKEYKSVKENVKENYKDAIEPQRVTNVNHVVGFQPIVPNALLNLPKSMITQDRKVNRKVINLFISPRGLSGVSSTEFLKYNTLVRNIVETIEQKTPHKFNIYVYGITRERFSDDQNEVIAIKIKHSNESFNFRKHGFIIGHAAFQRRIMFRIAETNPWQKQLDSGYGRLWSLKDSEKKELLNMSIRTGEGEVNIIIPDINDMDLTGDYLTKAFNKYFKEVIEK